MQDHLHHMHQASTASHAPCLHSITTLRGFSVQTQASAHQAVQGVAC